MHRDELAAVAADVGADAAGVMTAALLRRAGADADAVKRALASSWQAPVRGVYLPHRRVLTDVELAHVGLAHAGPDAVVSGLLAARALGLRWLPEDIPGVLMLVPAETRRKAVENQVPVRRIAGLSDLSTQLWNGVPLAPTAQVVVDSCRQLLAFRRPPHRRATGPAFEAWCLRDIRGIVLGAVADRHCTVAELREVLERGAMRDSALIRRACVDASRGAASPPEAELVDGLLEHGILFACNVEVWDDDVLVAVLDVHLIGTGVGGEIDSKEAHERADLLDATLLRHSRVESYGTKLCHVTPTRYRSDPAAFHAELFAEARSRLARGLGDPPGLRYVLRGPVMRGPKVSNPPYRLPSPLPRAA